MRDGAPPNFHIAVRDFLNNLLLGQLIGRSGPAALPAISPNINILFFLSLRTFEIYCLCYGSQ
jgi:hypothetical protein